MLKKNYLQKLFLFGFFALFVVNVFGQSDAGSFILKTGQGYILVHNGDNISYTLEFKGREYKSVDSDHPTFVIDGKLIQVVTVPNNYFWKETAKQKQEPTSEQLLEAHKIWESDYLSEEMGKKLSVTSEILEINQQRKAMLWSFAMPKELDSDYTHQLFLTTLVGKNILGLNASVESADAQKTHRDYLLEVMKTLKTSEQKFDIKQIKESLAKENLTE